MATPKKSPKKDPYPTGFKTYKTKAGGSGIIVPSDNSPDSGYEITGDASQKDFGDKNAHGIVGASAYIPLPVAEKNRRLSDEDDFELWRRAYLEQKLIDKNRGNGGGTINGVSVQEATGKTSAQIKRDNPSVGSPSGSTTKTYTPEETAANRQEMINRGQGYREKVAMNEQSQRNKYRQFLADRGEDPDTIGGATLQEPEKRQGETRAERFASVLQDQGEDDPVARAYALRQLKKEQSTSRGMTLPSLVQEEAAQSAIAKEQGARSRLSIAAKRLRYRDPEQSARLKIERDKKYPLSRSSETNRRNKLARFNKPSPYQQRIGNANGYSQ